LREKEKEQLENNPAYLALALDFGGQGLAINDWRFSIFDLEELYGIEHR